MGYCEIVVDACPRRDVRWTLECAQEMADAFGAKLAVASYAWPRSTITEALAGNALTAQQQYRDMVEALGVARSVFDDVFRGSAVPPDWYSEVTEPTAALFEHLFSADLLITSAVEGQDTVSPDVAHLAMRSGVPILRLGKNAETCRFPSALVAWKDSAQARRAVHDAMPILQRTERVTIVGVGHEVAIERLEMVANHLRRHGVTAEHLHIPHTHSGIGDDLLAEARRVDASLIIAGVYSRGSVRERVLGGVTRDLLHSPEISWFLAH